MKRGLHLLQSQENGPWPIARCPELPRAFVKLALQMCRHVNSTLDAAFYDVPTLVTELRERGEAVKGRAARPSG